MALDWLQGLNIPDVSGVSDVQPRIHADLARYVSKSADVSDVSAPRQAGPPDTSDTSGKKQAYQPKPAWIEACTPDTSDTSQKTEVCSDAATSDPGGRATAVSRPESRPEGGANQWRLFFAGGQTREVTFAPAATAAQVRRDYPGAIALILIASTTPTCELCVHASRYGNCGEPVEAGLSERFVLIKHDDGGRGCKYYAQR